MLSVVFLALALSVDAFAVAFSYGLILRKNLFANALKLGIATGFGQFIMPIVGWLATDMVSDYLEIFGRWAVFAAFFMLGANVLWEAFAKKSETNDALSSTLSFTILAAVAFATSIDACISGISLYFMPVNIWLSALLIGAVCMVVTITGFAMSCCFRTLPVKGLQVVAGLVLIGLAVRAACGY